MLKVQEYLHSGKTLQDLKNEYAISANVSKTTGLVNLNYNQIESPMSEQLVQECRTLILEPNTWNVIGKGFNKFFNYDEPNGKTVLENFDFNSAKSSTKLDGSIIVLYYYKDQWHWSTKSVPDADGEINQTRDSFKSLILKTISEMGFTEYSFTDGLDYNKSYIFELTSPYNPVVIKYKSLKMTLIGIYNNIELKEESIYSVSYNFPVVDYIKISNIEECIDYVGALSINNDNGEGVVIYDKYYNRIKVKNNDYRMAHRIVSNCFTMKQQLETILLDKMDDVYGLLNPYIQKDVDNLKLKLHHIKSIVHADYEKYKGIESQKDFAMSIKGNVLWDSALFDMRKGCSFDEIINKKTNTLLDLLEKV